MKEKRQKAVAIVGVGAVLPDAAGAEAFWANIKDGRYSIGDVPEGRWDPELYYDPDPKVPAKTYSRIGGWVTQWPWEPLKWRLPIPPRVSDALDRAQKWAIVATREALADYGYPKREIDRERTAVILGNAMGGDNHYLSSLRIFFPEYADELAATPSFSTLPETTRRAIMTELTGGISERFPVIDEDTMPGELSNIIAGRVAALFDLNGPNYVCDAACASAMAAFDAAIEGLEENEYDMVLTGGIDANMSASSFVKFCKIGALSATGTRPYAEGADGFVMGEGAALFVLKRLADAERDGDRIYAVVRGVGGASDGKGKGITAPNPKGQRLAIERAWRRAGIAPKTATLIEGHGTSTKVGDVVEVESMNQVFGAFELPAGAIALGSVKSNIGHLKGAAGAAGMLKVALALHEKVLPPSLGFERPNPAIDFAHSPFYVNTELRPWEVPGTNGGGAEDRVLRAGVSAFGFGGTNFHAVLEEYVPGRIASEEKQQVTVGRAATASSDTMTVSKQAAIPPASPPASQDHKPVRGIVMLGAASEGALTERLGAVAREAAAGRVPAPAPPTEHELRAPWRLAIDYGDAAELASKAKRALKAANGKHPGMWRALRAQGIFRGHGEAPKVAFLYTGQGSQYVNMLADLRRVEPIVEDTFAEADAVMEPLLGNPLSDYIFVDSEDSAAMAQAAEDLRQTEITQPAVLATDIALTRLLAAYGVEPDMVMGHSLGEYGALVAAGCLPFDQSLEAVSARGKEMSRVSVEDKGLMAAVFAPIEEIEQVLEGISGYVVIANINSHRQAVIGGATAAVREAVAACEQAGHDVRPLPVSHAFHTQIVAPASKPLERMLAALDFSPPEKPIICNVTGEFYPMGPGVVPQMINLLGQQMASPVQFVKGLETLHGAGATMFVEVGPKRALHGFAENVLGHQGCQALFTNHPKSGGLVSFNHALCGLYAAGLGAGRASEPIKLAAEISAPLEPPPRATTARPTAPPAASPPVPRVEVKPSRPAAVTAAADPAGLVRQFAEFLERGGDASRGPAPAARPLEEPVTVTGAALGLPGGERVFDDANVARLLRGEQMIDAIPMRFRRAMVDKHITRLVKTGGGGPRFETIDSPAEVIKLAGRAGALDLTAEFGYPEERLAALDVDTRLAIGVGLEALRDAGIPLVMRYKTTTTGSQLPERWGLPDALRDDTGVIFGSAFPGIDAFARECEAFYGDRARRQRVDELESLRSRLEADGVTPEGGERNIVQTALDEIDQRLAEARQGLENEPYTFDRRFLFKVLSMGHSQFAELIGARGPNTQINAACATTTQAVSLAEDWIRAGRCRRVIVVAADDVTSDHVIEWFASGFLASGAAATDELVEDAAVPFDRRRHGMIMGMGAAGLVVESAESARERGIAPIAEVLAAVTANSAFHGTRLDVSHIRGVMEDLVSQAEARWGVDRHAIAPECVFVSHETYTPARGGSAQAEVDALRHVFGPSADRIVVTNTKGYTGHAMAAGVEDVLAVKALETGLVPPVPNYREIDPDLGQLNLSQGGIYPVRYALRLGAGFGSQISLSLLRRGPSNGAHRAPEHLGYDYRIADGGAWNAWLARISGYDAPALEVDHRTLRVADQGPPAATAKPAAGSQPTAAPTPAQATPAPLPAAPAPTAVAAPTPTPAPVAATPAATAEEASDTIAAKVLEIVSEQTGYPPDMLDLDLDMEADLGIDTVKQAETFAAIRGEWDIPRDDNLALRDYPTLKHAIDFVYERRPDLQVGAANAPAEAPAPTPALEAPAPVIAEPTAATAPAAADAAVANRVEQRILEIVSEQTGYPTDMLELDLDMEADLGIDTVKQAETFAAIRGEWDIPRDDNLALRDYPTLKHAIGFVYERRPDLKTATSEPVAVPASPVAPPTSRRDVGAPSVREASTGSDEVTTGDAASADHVEQRILEIVSEQTGYPPDMLELDLDMEADLGIDTVKQAETFAAIRGEWDIPRDDNLQLRDYPTLKHAIGFVYERRPDLTPATPEPVAVSASRVAPPTSRRDAGAPSVREASAGSDEAPAGDAVEQRILEIVSEQTGYPPDMLELDLDMEADLGIDTVKQAETFAAIRGEWDIPRDDNLQLRDYPTLKHAIGFVYERRPDLTPATPEPAAVPASSVAPPTSRRDAGAPSVQDEPTGSDEAKTGDAASADQVEQRILEIVSEQTGYPPDMLELDLDMEADLGIDTVKQAETFAAIRGEWDIPRDDNLQLRDYPTLKHAIGFVYEKRPELKPGAAQAPAPAVPAEPAADAAIPADAAPAGAAPRDIPRRVPKPVLRPALELTKATGVRLEAGRRVVVRPDRGGVGKALMKRLEKRGVEVLTLDGELDRETLATRLDACLAGGPIHGVYWLPALDPAGDPAALDAVAWRSAVEGRVKHLYLAMRALYEQIAGDGTFLVAATRLGGRHGVDAAGAADPLGGAVTGFVKTYKRERPEVLVKAVDFAPSRKTAALAERLIAETESDPGAVEIGYAEGERWGVGLVESEAVAGDGGVELGGDSVFVVTGAAGSITSAIVGDLATSGGTFHLLDLAPEPDPDNPDLERFVCDREGLQRDVFERLKASGERATPARVQKELAGMERQRAALDAIRAVRAAGGEAYYHSLDLRDGEAVGAVVDEVRRAHGRIDVLVHAAGLEISHFLPDKPTEEFDLVFDVKADGWYHLLHAVARFPRRGTSGRGPLGATVAFSSIAGRFGNAGQADYSAANDLLAKWTSSFRSRRPEVRGVTVDWTAWADIGMATRGSIPKMMALAGIDMLPPAAGIPVVRRELTAAGDGGEVVVAGSLGTLLEGWDETGGLEIDRFDPIGPVAGAVKGIGSDGALTVETALDPAEQPFLRDHAMDGTPLYPGVMGIEAFAEAAALVAGKNANGRVAVVEDVDFLAPFKFYRGQPRSITVRAGASMDGGDVVASCLLEGSRQLPKEDTPRVTTHYTGRVRWTAAAPEVAEASPVPAADGDTVAPEDIYRIYFHGPAYRVLDGAWKAVGGTVVGRLAESLGANHHPPELPLQMAPRLVELCFQTAGVWEIGTTGRLALPNHVDRVRLLGSPDEAKGRLHALVEPPKDGDGNGFNARVVDEEGTVFLELEGYRTIAVPSPLADDQVAPLRAVMA